MPPSAPPQPTLPTTGASGEVAALDALLADVPVDVSVELGRTRLALGDLAARLGPGSIIPLDKAAGAPLDLRINGRLVARAEAIAIGERCGVRILELVGSGT
ncbi:MAG: FliM/FliN family flagellar motor switch protein [Kofleriaceae bacterium]